MSEETKSPPISAEKKIMDHLFVIDATGSMSAMIKAAHDKATELAINLKVEHPDVEFKFGAVCFRDPVDVSNDKHDSLDFVDDIDSLVSFLSTMAATGGGDGPEDYAGALEIALNKLSWRDGPKSITFITDAPAHGKKFCGSENHEDQTSRLTKLVEELAKRKIFISALSVNSGADHSFAAMEEIYKNAGGPQFKSEQISIAGSQNLDSCIHERDESICYKCAEASRPKSGCSGGGSRREREYASEVCAMTHAAPCEASCAPSADAKAEETLVRASTEACNDAISSYYK